MKNNMKEVFTSKVCNKNIVMSKVLAHKRKEQKYMKKLIPYLSGALAVLLLFFGFMSFMNKPKMLEVDYVKYLNENKKLVQERNDLKEELKLLYELFSNDEITQDEYFVKLEELKNKTNVVDKKIDSLKKDYQITDSLNLDEVQFSTDKKENEKMKDLYKKEIELERKEEELERKEDELDRKYRKGEISRSEYVKQIRELEQLEDELDIEEDTLEREEEKIGVDIEDEVITNNQSTNYISRDKAKSIALNDAGLKESKVRQLEVELDKEENKYEVNFEANGKEYSYEINATTGKIIDKEVERD